MGKWRYTGEQELIVPETVEGTRVVSQGDVVHLADSQDGEFGQRGDFEVVPEDTPTGVPAVEEVPAPREDPAPAPSQPIEEAPVSQEGEEPPAPQEAAEEHDQFTTEPTA